MPVIEITSFTVSKAFLPDDVSLPFDKAINAIKTIEECLSVHRGFELADKTQAYVIILWDSNDTAFQAKSHSGTFQLTLDRFGLTFENIRNQFFVLNENPTSLLDAPLLELWYTHLKPETSLTDVLSLAQAFTAQVGGDKFQEIKSVDCPRWIFASSDSNDGSGVSLVGWKNVELRENFVKARPTVEYLERVHELAGLENKILSLVKA